MGDLPVVRGLEGWREMTLLPGGILTSPQQECGFPERVAPPAQCNNLDHVGTAPGPMCTCGYYAVYKRHDATGYKGNCVVKISALGETEMHELGFRCAQFRIDEVYIQDEELAEALRERLGIDIFIEEAPCKSENENSASPQNLTQTLSFAQRQILQDVMQKTIVDQLLQMNQQQFQPLIPSPSPSGVDPFALLGHPTDDAGSDHHGSSHHHSLPTS